MTIQEATDQINAQDPATEYAHNIVSCILRAIARDHGPDAADELIRDLDLEQTYRIRPRKTAEDKKRKEETKAGNAASNN